MDYVKRKKVIEKINGGKYQHLSSPGLDRLMVQLNNSVNEILESKDLTELQSKQAERMHVKTNNDKNS